MLSPQTIKLAGNCGVCDAAIPAGKRVMRDPWRGILCPRCEKTLKSAAGAGRKRRHEKRADVPAPAPPSDDLRRRLDFLRTLR